MQILPRTPSARTLRQNAFNQGVDQIGQGIAGFANIYEKNQATERQQAFDVLKTTAALRENGFDVTPDQVAAQLKPAQSKSGFMGLFRGGSDEEEIEGAPTQAPAQDIFAKRTPEYIQKQNDASMKRKVDQAQYDDLYDANGNRRPFMQTSKGQEYATKESFDRSQKNYEREQKKEEDSKKSVLEIEDRRQNILDNVDAAINQIKEYGTYEATGSENENLNRWMSNVATDMAKLADPSSVARPSETEAVLKNLVSPTATGMTNSTALDILKNFKNEVNARADKAYKIRGIDSPGKYLPQNFNGSTAVKEVHPQVKAMSREEKIKILQGR